MAPPLPSVDPGEAHERRLAAAGTRKVRGAYYTPPALVAGVLDLVLDPVVARAAGGGVGALAALRVVDPACGSGRFLVGVGERVAAALVAAGVAHDEARRVAARCLHGVDRDAEATRLARAAVGS